MGPFVVVQALWLFLPAYVANMAPVFAAKAMPRWNARIDGGRQWTDGRPLLGEGKTWRGVWAGAVGGMATALLQSLVRWTGYDLSDFGASDADHLVAPAVIGFAMGLGAVSGDAVKSFFKRRTGRAGGRPWFPFDQLDFVVGGLLLGAVAGWGLRATRLTDLDWFVLEFSRHWAIPATVLVLTPLLHYLVNLVGFKLKLKQVPW